MAKAFTASEALSKALDEDSNKQKGKFRSKLFGTTDGSEFLPIKVVSDGGTPALGKLVCIVV